MIKCNEGEITLSGMPLELMAELTIIIKHMHEQISHVTCNKDTADRLIAAAGRLALSTDLSKQDPKEVAEWLFGEDLK